MASSPAKQFIVHHSGGLIKTEGQAMGVIVAMFLLSMAFCGYLFFTKIMPPPAEDVLPMPAYEEVIDNT